MGSGGSKDPISEEQKRILNVINNNNTTITKLLKNGSELLESLDKKELTLKPSIENSKKVMNDLENIQKALNGMVETINKRITAQKGGGKPKKKASKKQKGC